MPPIIQIDYRLLIASGNFGVYWIVEEQAPYPGFIGSWALLNTVSSGGNPWSPPANVVNAPLILVSGACIGAYSINGALYTFTAQYPPSLLSTDRGILVSTNTGILVAESTLYSVAAIFIGATWTYIISSANGNMWQSTDFIHWTNVTSGFVPAPTNQMITQPGLNNANNNAPPGISYVFGTPQTLCEGGINEHTGPPYSINKEGGAIYHVQPPKAVTVDGGVIELTNSITGPLPPVVGQGGFFERVGIPVRTEG